MPARGLLGGVLVRWISAKTLLMLALVMLIVGLLALERGA